MNIYLAKLREKPMPNIKHKEGVHIFVGKKIEQLEEEEDDLVIEKPAIEETNLPEEEKEDETKEDEPIKPKNVCQIRDGRKNASIDYNAIKKALMEKGTLLTEKKTLPKQMGEVQEKEEDKLTKDINVILEKEKKKDIEEDEMVEKPVVIKQAKIRNIAMENIDSNMVLDGDSLKTRLPKDEQMTIRSSGYYMNNRKKFISHLMPLFDKYKRELSNKGKEESCDDKSKQSEKGEFNLMIHQRVVRDYLNLYTPYRGLLLYHGLGSGKTCTSIAIAEGMKSQKKNICIDTCFIEG